MKLTVETPVMGSVLDKVCRIASPNPDDGIKHEMKVVTVDGKGAFFEAGNAIRTMTVRIHLDDDHCDVDGETEFCVPAYPLRSTINLMKEGTVTFERNGRSISISETDGDEDEHVIVGSDPSEWQGPPVLNDALLDVSLSREALLAIGELCVFSCSQDKTQAPLTGIHLHISPDKSIRAVSTDKQKLSILRDEDGCVEIRDIPDEGFDFLLPPSAAKFIPQVLDGDGPISMKANDKRALFGCDGVQLDVTAEIGVAGYPAEAFAELTNVPDQFEWDMDTKELNRITKLVAIVASKTLAKIRFNKTGDKMTISGVGLSGKGNKSRQTMKATETTGNLMEDSVIEVACADFAEAISIPTTETIKVGMSKTTSPQMDIVIRLRQEGPMEWEHVVFPAIQVDF